MWRWLPSALCNKTLGCFSARRIFFLQLFGIVLGIHVLIFGMYGIISWMQSGHDRFKISLTQSGVTYVLMPFQKRVNQKNQVSNVDENRALKKSNVIDQQTYERKKNAQKKSKNVEKKAVTQHTKNKKISKSTKQTASVMMQSEKKQAVVSKQSKQKKSVTKIQDNVIEQDVIQPKEVAIEPKVEMTEPVVPIQQIAVVQPAIEENVIETEDDFDENNVIFIGNEELDQSLIGSKIQHEIQQNWIPPVGMKKDISCEVRVKIDADGQAIETKVIKGSGVFVYDATAKKTLQKIEFPKEVRNKTITIILGST